MEWLNVRRSIDISCVPRPLRYYQQAVLINIEQVDDYLVKREVNQHTVKFSLKDLESGCLFRSNELANAFTGTFSEVREQGVPLYSHQVAAPIVGVTQQAKLLLKELDNGRYFLALQNRNGVIEIYGFENGLQTEDYDYDASQYNTIELTSRGLETDPPLIYVSDGNAQRDFDDLFENISLNAEQERYFISEGFTDIGIFNNTDRQTAWRPIDSYCIQSNGANNGQLAYTRLELYDVVTGQGLSVFKDNIQGDEDYTPPIENTTACPLQSAINVNPSSVNLDYTAQSFNLTINPVRSDGAAVEWGISDFPAGISFSQLSGIGQATINVTVTENTGDASLNKSFTITTQDGATRTVTVNQEYNEDNALIVNPTNLEFSAFGETKNVTVTTDQTWNYTEGITWLSVERQGNVLEVTAEENTGSSRSGVIDIIGGLSSSQIEVTQQAAALFSKVLLGMTNGSFTGANTAQEAVNNNHSRTVYATTNTIEQGTRFYNNASGSNALNGGNKWFMLDGTSTAIKINSNGYFVESVNTAVSLQVSPSNVNRSAGAVMVNLTVTSNTDWEVTSKPSWINIVSGSTGSGNGTIGLSITENTGSLRSGSVVVRGGGAQASSLITQQQASPITLDPTSIVIGSSGGSFAIEVDTSGAWTAEIFPTSQGAYLSQTSGNGSGFIIGEVPANNLDYSVIYQVSVTHTSTGITEVCNIQVEGTLG